ncbi:hypothetical protein KCP78_21630 [Salmonella enterica subsp. enterica]|nr:hypothetical protein KCP78_21630 [Salmonella enterica subsp. enterica]
MAVLGRQSNDANPHFHGCGGYPAEVNHSIDGGEKHGFKSDAKARRRASGIIYWRKTLLANDDYVNGESD